MKKSAYKQCISVLESLHTKYPTYTISQHVATAMADYGDFWGLTDKEFLFALNKYCNELELDIQNVVSEKYVDMIIKDANDLFTEVDE